MLPGLTGDPDRPRQLRVGGILQDGAVGEDDERQLRLGTRLLDQCPTFVRIGEVERVGHRAPSEGLPQLEGSPGPRVADDEHGVRRRALRFGPVEEHPGDRVMEELIRRRGRPEHVVVDAALGDRIEDRLTRRGVAPLPPSDEQAALRVRVEPTRLVEQLAARHACQPLRRQDQRNVVTRGGDLLESLVARPAASARTRPGSGDRSDRSIHARHRAVRRRRRRPRSAQARTLGHCTANRLPGFVAFRPRPLSRSPGRGDVAVLCRLMGTASTHEAEVLGVQFELVVAP